MNKRIKDLLAAAANGDPLKPVDLAYLAGTAKQLEADRLVLDKEAAEAKAAETAVKLTIIGQMKLQKINAIGGKAFTAAYKTEDQPTVRDWPKFYSYILKTKAWDLLERRVGKAAVKARWEDGKEVPGVEKFPVDKLSFTKSKG